MQGENHAFTLVRCADEDEWLAVRRQGVGGSDVAAIMGLSPWRSPYEVWLEKTGRADPPDLSERASVHWGNVLEPVVGAEYAGLHPDSDVRRVNAVLRSVSRPWAQASLDYEVHDPGLGWGILEIKTVGFRSLKDWEDGVPLYYQTQCAHYMSVTGRAFCDVAVLIGGQDYREYRLMRDEADVAAVDATVDDFWNRNVMGGQEPAFTGNGSEVPAFLGQNPQADEEWVDADGDAEETLSVYLNAKSMADRYAKIAKAEGDKLKGIIGKAAGLRSAGGSLTWVRARRENVDLKGLKRDMPDVVAKYTSARASDGGLRWKAVSR